jgi:hypothetical protein
MELLVCVNAACFRAAALVREQRQPSNTCLQFVQISQGARNVLEDLIDRLTKLQTITRKLRSGQIDQKKERKLLDTGRFRIIAVGENEQCARGTDSAVKKAQASPAASPLPDRTGRKISQIQPEWIEIDLFG